MTDTTNSDPSKPVSEDENTPFTDPDEVLWIGFSDQGSRTIVRGPYTNESAAVESVSEYDTFHVEPRVPKSDGSESCVAENVMPTY